MAESAPVEYILPASLTGIADLSRLIREIETLESELQAQKVRSGGTAVHMPPTSQGLDDFVEQNKIDLTDGQQLMKLKERLRHLKEHAPVIHMTFATEADPYALEKLVTWLRAEIHPHALVSAGLQPSLIGGVYMRTPNHVHDYSLKSLLHGKRDIILKELEGLQ